ncbi:MAG: PIN domain-containing protein [Solirubrobacterales bacterium]
MTTLLLDASAILAAFDPEDDCHAPASALLTAPDFTLTTIDLVRYEVANVAIRAWRAPATVAPLLDAVDRIAEDGGVIEAKAPLIARAADLADRHGISVYDAAYVAAAREAERVLVSCDARDLVSKDLASLPEDALDS